MARSMKPTKTEKARAIRDSKKAEAMESQPLHDVSEAISLLSNKGAMKKPPPSSLKPQVNEVSVVGDYSTIKVDPPPV